MVKLPAAAFAFAIVAMPQNLLAEETVVASSGSADVVGAAGLEVREQYRECITATGYDYMCERQRYEDA